MEEQEGGRKDCQHEFHEHPIVPEQTPRSAQRHDEAGQQRTERQRDDHGPRDHLGRQIGGPHRLEIVTGQAGNGKREEGPDGSQPADRRRDMRGQRELPESHTRRLRRHSQNPADWPTAIATMLTMSKRVKGEAIRKNAP